MSLAIQEQQQVIKSAGTVLIAKTLVLDGPYAPQPPDPRLRLDRLVSRRTLDSRLAVDNHRFDVQSTVESVGSNGVRHIANILVCESRTEKTHQRILTVHTQMFASLRDTIPAFTDVRTVIFDIVEVTQTVRELSITVVDENGIHRVRPSRLEILYERSREVAKPVKFVLAEAR